MKKSLKHVPKSQPDAYDDMASLDEFTATDPRPGHDPAEPAPRLILAMSLVQGSLTARDRARIARDTGTAMIVGVPGPDWVDPVAAALTRVGSWGVTFRRKGGKASEKPETGSDEAAVVLGAGRNVLGVSHDPDRLLPASLVATQDIRIDLPPPGPWVLRAAIELVTGMRPRRVPQGAARGLTFDEVTACLRRGSRPSDCVRRLVAASQAKLRGDVALNDVPVLSETHGYGEAADWGLRLAAAVEEWRNDRRNFSDLPEKCAVFSGPAGVGKSSYVRSLAKTLGMPLVATSVAAWFTSGGYLDQVLKAIDAVFAQAASLSPAVLFLDEIDAIPNRSRIDSRHAEYWIALTSHILTKLDSATSGDTSRLVVVGATNFPERLDEALIRPGRLNRVIPIHMPDQAAVAGILRQHLGDDLPGADLAPLAVVGLGSTGAEIASWVRGARDAALSERRPMSLPDLVARIAPPETRSPAAQLAVARHESAHCLGTEILAVGTVEAVSIVGRGRFAGRTNARLRAVETMTGDEIDALVVSVLCGRAADEHWGAPTSGAAGGTGSDLAVATHLVACKHGSYGLGGTLAYRGPPSEITALVERNPGLMAIVEADLRRLYETAQALIRDNEAVVEALDRRLVRSRILSGAEVRAVIGSPELPEIPVDTRLADVGGAHG